MSITCSACGHENREGRKFCAECGVSLTAPACASCGATNDPGEKFCGECGTALTLGTFQTPGPVPLPHTPERSEGERKHITVLFADVAGSMGLQERLDAEVWAQIMGRFVSILAEGVRRFGGTVDKFTGDGIMALFGAPVAQEDHARRACHAAWHLTKAIGEYSEELRRGQSIELHVRLGLSSGEVVVGRVGDDLTLDPTALGHTVGLAQRMEAMAEPGKAYLAEYTARLVEGWFRLEALGPVPVKGSSEPVPVYTLGAPLSSRIRPTIGVSPLVGRERELAVLEDALAMAKEGQAEVVGVVGEAGVGKSRLYEEFGRSAAARGITVRRTAGVSHGKEVSLLPILAFLRDYFEISDGDTDVRARDKIAGRLLALDSAFDEGLPLLFDFLEVPDPDRPAPQLAPEVRMDRLFETFRRVTARRSEQEVFILVAEDLHWFDAQSEAFLERLIESFPRSRTLVLTNFRPEFSAAWMRHSYYRQVPLGPLRDEAVSELLVGWLGHDQSLAPLIALALERTGGNPFFVEEVVRVLVSDGTLVGTSGAYRLSRPLSEVRVPPTVQGTLEARIDRLPAGQKTLLQTAAVIGRTFSEPVLSAVTAVESEALAHALRGLCASELLQETARVPGGEYRFWHPLTQEVAYGTLLASRKALLHAAVAETLSDQPGRSGERAGVIAWHWERAGRPVEAAHWLMEAGNWALRTNLAEAERRWRAAIHLLEGVAETTRSQELAVAARVRLFQFGARTGVEQAELDHLYAEARALAERLGDPKLLAWTVAFSGSSKFWSGQMSESLSRFAEGFALAEQAGDCDLQATVGFAPAVPLLYMGPLSEGLAYVEHTLELCTGDPERGAARLGYSPLTRCLEFRARALLLNGRLSEAARDLDLCLALARPRAEPEPLCWALSLVARLGWISGVRGGSDAAAEAVKIAEETGNTAGLVLALQSTALSEMMAGRPSAAISACERALSAARERRSGLFEEGSVLAHLSAAHLAAGDPAVAGRAADEAVAVARLQEARVVECLALIARAQAERAMGKADEAQGDLAAASALIKETGALTYEPFIHEELGRLRHDEHELREALRLYTAIGATGHAQRLEAELAQSPRAAK